MVVVFSTLLAIALALFSSTSTRTINFVQFEFVTNTQATYGDSLTWDAEQKVLYFTDVVDRQLVRLDPATDNIKRIKFGCELRPVFPVAGSPNQVVVGCGNHLLLATLHWNTPMALQKTKVLATVGKGGDKTNVFSGGRVDPNGAIVVGIKSSKSSTGSILRFDPTKDSARGKEKVVSTVLDSGYTPASIDWSPDAKHFYSVDSDKRKVYVYDYDKHTGNIKNRKDFLDFTKAKLDGKPTGIVIDAARSMWVLCADAGNVGKVIRVFLKGTEVTVDDKLPLDAPFPTSVVFAGTNLTDLYVASARSVATKEQLTKYPNSGSIFRYFHTVKGKGQKPCKANIVN